MPYSFGNKHKLVILVVISAIGLGILGITLKKVKLKHQTLANQLSQLPDHNLVTLNIDGKQYRLEVVNTPKSMTLGLGKRNRGQVKGDGMIFVLPQTQVAQFWMKDMRFSLDFYWLDEEGNVVGFEKNIPPPKPTQTTDKLPIISSKTPVRLVVELPASDTITP